MLNPPMLFPASLSFIAPLDHLGLIAVTGSDAAVFLHRQLTNDCLHLDEHQVRLAGYCSAKGRLLATMLVWKTDDSFYVQLPKAILSSVQKRLSMVILRSKVVLTDVSAHYVTWGVCGEDAALQCLLSAWHPQLPQTPYQKRVTQHGTLLQVANIPGKAARYQWILAIDQQDLPPRGAHCPLASAAAWRLSDIHAGIVAITQATQEKFVPHMVNFEQIGGIHFKKGCYPGQEVVARMQYLGKMKRRTFFATVVVNPNETVTPAMAIFSSQANDGPCGEVVNAEVSQHNPQEHHYDCLVVMPIALVEEPNTVFHLDRPDGAILQCHGFVGLQTTS